MTSRRDGKKNEHSSIPAASAARTRNTLLKPPCVLCSTAIIGTATRGDAQRNHVAHRQHARPVLVGDVLADDARR